MQTWAFCMKFFGVCFVFKIQTAQWTKPKASPKVQLPQEPTAPVSRGVREAVPQLVTLDNATRCKLSLQNRRHRSLLLQPLFASFN